VAGQIGAVELPAAAQALEAAILARSPQTAPLLEAFEASLTALLITLAPWVEAPPAPGPAAAGCAPAPSPGLK
jgi:hypothetical protein